MKKIEIPQTDEFQTFRPDESLRSFFVDSIVDIFSEPRLPVRSKRHFDFDKLFEGFEPFQPFDPAESEDVNTVVDNGANDSDTTLINNGTNDSDTTLIDNNATIPADTVNDTIESSTTEDNEQEEFRPRPPRAYDHISFNMGRSILRVSVKFVGGMIDLADFDPRVRKVNATSVKSDVDIIGNDSDNSLKGGKGDDTLIGGEGNDTLTGGSGENTFVYETGDDVITDYTAKKDKIQIAADGLTDVTAKGSSVVFTFEEGGTLTIKNGQNKNITLVDEDDNEITEKFTLKNIDRAEELLADLWFTPEVENFANEGDQQFDSILEDDEDYSSIVEPEEQLTNSFTKGNKFKPVLTYGRGGKERN